MNIPPLPVALQINYLIPISIAPWLEVPELRSYDPPLGKPKFQSWITSRTPTRPEPQSWIKYGTPHEWIISVMTDNKIGDYPTSAIHHYEWPFILNHNIMNMRVMVNSNHPRRWGDIEQTDGIHNYVYSFQRHPSKDQLITVYNIYHRYFKWNHPDIK